MKLRSFLCRVIFASCARDVKIHPMVYFGSGKDVHIGSGSNLSIGSWISNDTKIGCDVMVGPNLFIISSNHAFADRHVPMRLQGMEPSEPVVIKDDVWIGANVTILSGVTINSHSIVGAGSVVTKDIPEYSIVGGNPAKIIRSR